MTEQGWLACAEPERMLRFLRGRASDRKWRLFACACCRLIWEQIPDLRSRRAVEVAESFVDGAATAAELEQAHRLAAERAADTTEVLHLAAGVVVTATSTAFLSHLNSTVITSGLVGAKMAWYNAITEDDARTNAAHAWRKLAALLRHIVGNPFRPFPVSATWPSTVVQLADALYNGQDCGFALHDALLEAGHSRLAEHFREEQAHPKGCWAVDVILGKE